MIRRMADSALGPAEQQANRKDPADKALSFLANRRRRRQGPQGIDKAIQDSDGDSAVRRLAKKGARTASRYSRSTFGIGAEDLPSWRGAPEGHGKARHHYNQYHDAVGKAVGITTAVLTGGKVKASWVSDLATRGSKATMCRLLAVKLAFIAAPFILAGGVIALFIILFGGGIDDDGLLQPERPAAQSATAIGEIDLDEAFLFLVQPQESAAAEHNIPAEYLEAYKEATLGTQVPWTVLAAIAGAATDHGRFSPYDDCDRRPQDGAADFIPIRQFSTSGTFSSGQESDLEDCGGSSGRHLAPDPPIGGPDDPAFGHYLLYSSVGSALAEPTAVSAVAGSATEYLVDRLAELRDDLIEEGWAEPVWAPYGTDSDEAELAAASDFWAEAVSRLPIADSAALGCQATPRDTSSRTAVLTAIREIWRCVLSSTEDLLTYSYDLDQGWYRPVSSAESRPSQTRLLLSEAEQTAGVWSDLGADRAVTSQDLCGRVSIVREFGGGPGSGMLPSSVIVGDLHAEGLSGRLSLMTSVEADGDGWADGIGDPQNGVGLIVHRDGAGSNDMQDLIEAAGPWLLEKDRLVLSFGTNDLLNGGTGAEAAAAFGAAARHAAAISSRRGSALKVLWVDLYLDPDNLPHGAPDDIMERLESINSAVAAEADKHVLAEVLGWGAYVSTEASIGRSSPMDRSGAAYRSSYYDLLGKSLDRGIPRSTGVGQALSTDPLIQGVSYSDDAPVAAAERPVGIFPLTADVFDSYNSVDGATRCDPVPNILAAAKAFADNESSEGRTSGTFRDYRPEDIIGGWRAMPAVLGSEQWRDEFLENGKGLIQRPDPIAANAALDRDICMRESVGSWIAGEIMAGAYESSGDFRDLPERPPPLSWPAVLTSEWHAHQLDSFLRAHAVGLLGPDGIAELDSMEPEDSAEAVAGHMRSLSPSQVDEALAEAEPEGGPLTDLVSGMRATGREFPSEPCARASITAGSPQYSDALRLWAESELLFPDRPDEVGVGEWLRSNLMHSQTASGISLSRPGDADRVIAVWAQGMLNVHALSLMPGVTGDWDEEPDQTRTAAAPDGKPPWLPRLSSRAGVTPYYDLPDAPASAALPKLIIRIAEAYGGLSGSDDRGIDDPRADLASIIAGNGRLRIAGVPDPLMSAAAKGSYNASVAGPGSQNGTLDAAFLLAASHAEAGGAAGWRGMTERGRLEPPFSSERRGPFGLLLSVWNEYGNGSEDGIVFAGPAAEAAGRAHLAILGTPTARSILKSNGPWDLSKDRDAQIVSAYLMRAGRNSSAADLDRCMKLYETQADGRTESPAAAMEHVSAVDGCGAVMHALGRWFVAEDYRRLLTAARLTSLLSGSSVTHERTGFTLPVPTRGPSAASTDGCLVQMGGLWGDPRGTPSKPRRHQGIDIMDCDDDKGPLLPLFSVADGIVVNKYTDLTSLSGLGLRIRHENIAGHSHVDTLYLHMATFDEEFEGDDWHHKQVRAGQRIGTMGNTGVPANTTPLHLHFEIRIVTDPSKNTGQTPVNPISWIPPLGKG